MKNSILVILFCFMFFPATAFSWQPVTVEEARSEEESLRENRDRALDSGFRKAVLQEMGLILPGRISQERLHAVMSYIDGRVEGLVQGYRGVSVRETDHGLILEMEVNIDSSSLRRILQDAGVYYTSLHPWSYDLNTSGASPDDLIKLQHLQLITGVQVDSTARTVLSLRKSGQGAWSGSIGHQHVETSVSAESLEKAWFELWKYFFGHPDIRDRFVRVVILSTSGWPTTDAVMNFDRILAAWKQEVESGKIVSVFTDVPSMKATWKVLTLNPESLEKRLQNYLPARGVAFNIE
ncbi:hypothetical protein [Desulfonatronovibrio hydrogenovorans]|uniref:hypothetical protein n=1 Tax=Desulfonatronovibrio hydrogenovorans TaxID=53245 RepID=UPI00048DF86A|nr:hypothetical protein [Desulfonatronovibrio hydrogenovorans]